MQWRHFRGRSPLKQPVRMRFLVSRGPLNRHLPEAADLYREACISKQGGRNPNLLSHLGDVLAARGLAEDAIGCYRAAIALDTCGSSSVEAAGLGLAHWHEQHFRKPRRPIAPR